MIKWKKQLECQMLEQNNFSSQKLKLLFCFHLHLINDIQLSLFFLLFPSVRIDTSDVITSAFLQFFKNEKTELLM